MSYENGADKYSKPGNVYVFVNLKRWKIKIGLTGRKVERRLEEIQQDYGRQVMSVFVCETSNMWKLEQTAHRKFRKYKSPEPKNLTGQSEWFALSPCLIIKVICFLFLQNKRLEIGYRIEKSWCFKLLNMLKR
jgi:hypothetical protein